MRRSGLFVVIALAACSDPPPPESRDITFAFGPFDLPAQAEDTSLCVQLSLENTDPVYVNTVELTTGPGFHHSNWFFVPDHIFAGEDGTYRCDDRGFDIAVAGLTGGVLFAQSTQSTTELQSFPAGMALKIPPGSKLVAQLHLLNRGDEPLAIEPTIKLSTVPEPEVERLLAGISMEFHPLSLPPRKQSRFTVECDLGELHRKNLGRDPDFHIFYTLAHYHEYGTRLMLEGVTEDGTASTIYTTQNSVGDALGGPLEPAYDMTGKTRLRLTCEYYNSTDSTIWYGNGDGEMCVFLAFSDSPWLWGGGVLDRNPEPDSGVDQDGVMTFTRSCQLFTREAY